MALEGKTIDVFNNGEMLRDFTYVDDNPNWNHETSSAPYKVYNIGNNNPVKLHYSYSKKYDVEGINKFVF